MIFLRVIYAIIYYCITIYWKHIFYNNCLKTNLKKQYSNVEQTKI